MATQAAPPMSRYIAFSFLKIAPGTYEELKNLALSREKFGYAGCVSDDKASVKQAYISTYGLTWQMFVQKKVHGQ